MSFLWDEEGTVMFHQEFCNYTNKMDVLPLSSSNYCFTPTNPRYHLTSSQVLKFLGEIFNKYISYIPWPCVGSTPPPRELIPDTSHHRSWWVFQVASRCASQRSFGRHRLGRSWQMLTLSQGTCCTGAMGRESWKVVGLWVLHL